MQQPTDGPCHIQARKQEQKPGRMLQRKNGNICYFQRRRIERSPGISICLREGYSTWVDTEVNHGRAGYHGTRLAERGQVKMVKVKMDILDNNRRLPEWCSVVHFLVVIPGRQGGKRIHNLLARCIKSFIHYSIL